MNGTTSAAPNINALLRASEAITNWRALAATLLGGAVALLFIALTGWMMRTSVFLGFLLMLVTVVVISIAYSTVGIVLMRSAQGRDVTIMDALLQAAFSVHRMLGVGILLMLLVLGVFLAALLILFVCKIPGLGALLFAITYPALAVICGVTLLGYYLGALLASPAIWEGNSVFQTIARVMAIMRRRLLSVTVSVLMLIVLVCVLGSIVGFVLGVGNTLALGLSSAVHIPVFGGLSFLPHLFSLGGAQDFENAYAGISAYAGPMTFGMGLLFTLGAIVPFLELINGSCLIYLQAIDGLDIDDAEEQLRAGVDEAKRRAQEARVRASSKLDESKLAMAPAAGAAAAMRACSHCHSPLGMEDQFCGECGAKNSL